MIWSLYAMLGRNMWWVDNPELDFEDEAWDSILESCQKNGLNQIVLDVGEGLQYKCRPELSRKGAWSHERARAEVIRCREMGIELIPKLNFSATHHMWLGEYRRMMSTSIYYQVCRELIEEVYEVFDKPRYFHIGMDEEGDPQFFSNVDMVHFRQGELIWHDLQYLIDVVKECGAKPWIWGDMCVYNPEEFRKHIAADDVVLQPWIYYAVRPEHYTPCMSKPRWHSIKKDEGVDFVEEAHIWQVMTHEGVNAMNDGYETVPTPSNWGDNEWCHDDVVEHYVNNNKSGKLLGFMTAPWKHTKTALANHFGITNRTHLDYIIESIEQLAAARDKFCK